MESAVLGYCAGFGVTILWEYRKDLAECIDTTKKRRELHKAAPLKLSKHNYIEHPARTAVRWRFEKLKGIHILGGPAGCGKTTLLNFAMQSIRDNGSNRNILYLRDNSKQLFKDRNFHKTLHIPKRTSMSNHFPEGSVIVIDQFDLTLPELTSEMQNYIQEIASQNYNTVFNLILVVSDPQVMKVLLDTNDYKILTLCNPMKLKWGYDQATNYVDEHFSHRCCWTPNYFASLTDSITKAGMPCMISLINEGHSGRRDADNLLPMSPAQCVEIAEGEASMMSNVWEEWKGFEAYDFYF